MHIHKKELEKFQEGAMTSEEMIAFLTQIDSDDLSLDKFLENEEASGSITAPSYLKEQILNENQKYRTPKIQFWQYTLQTAAGVAAALLLLFSISNMDYASVWKARSVSQKQTSMSSMSEEELNQSQADVAAEIQRQKESENPQDSSAARQNKHLSDLTRKIQHNITCTAGSMADCFSSLTSHIFGR